MAKDQNNCTFAYSVQGNNGKQKAGLLKRWFKQVVATGIKELRSFVKGLVSDFEAVKMQRQCPGAMDR
ncbi:hypothetical protein OCK74_11970 [Chitinophagaceae bacterium LB-8]|uniref:Uncharacterized protein n=1 Tax=Paraflavisolibacter caeni TaxID=2982496 RepID=A0A9X2XNW7_9BACT|nr:hypothetical protein [Paraflavisolibacter caeni]MCU7549838.1 hypothetical protein [Paraflavisolibacter caeni]